jgi:hypothetical protein
MRFFNKVENERGKERNKDGFGKEDGRRSRHNHEY